MDWTYLDTACGSNWLDAVCQHQLHLARTIFSDTIWPRRYTICKCDDFVFYSHEPPFIGAWHSVFNTDSTYTQREAVGEASKAKCGITCIFIFAVYCGTCLPELQSVFIFSILIIPRSKVQNQSCLHERFL